MSQFAASLPEVFEKMGRIEVKRMFGGHGLFLDGRMFALVSKDTLYLKSDAQTASHFDERQLPPFTYLRAGKPTPTSYRQAPEEVFEDRDEAARWGARAFEVALRSGAPASRKKRQAPRRA
ncbi:TfoX/Sxy family protein [Variovorax sp. J22R133]|uniref:TfoX/Sxy family protein n=1 Tax=Variovorax brevis TaxID=3053503 RepID=UPI0025785233|nr:TfoX/Sxy family protein [Variovorax sp. J22R133]MDM0113449.1 TfoX/Sxy family protein [Variovorax sp. J22R133]